MSAPPKPVRLSIAELRAGQRVEDQVYRIAQKDLRTTNTGSLYIHAVLADATGQLVARLWNASQELYDSMAESGLMQVCGRVEMYKGKPQFIIDGLRHVDPGSIDANEFLPKTAFDVDAMWARVVEIMGGIEQPDLRALVNVFLNEPAFVERFKRAPAARNLHHAFLGGLLEHTLNLLELALLVLPRYPRVSRDLVLAGILFHDAGKTAELGYATNFDYTSEGQLLGHIVQSTIWVHEAARRLETQTGRPFPPQVLMMLKHIIVAHHGKYEFGSPKLPACAEAFMVHYLDNLDAKLNMVFSAIDGDVDEASEWTGWVPALETKLFKRDVTGRATPKPPPG